MVKLDEDNLREPTPITPLQLAQSHGLEFKMSHVEVDIPEDSKFSWKKLFEFLGPGFFISVGYIDPGNWASDIEGGSRFGYKLIWVLLLSNWMALLLQTLAVRLGLVTQFDLAQCCGKEYPKFVRYSLWILCEIAIAATDVAEVLGTAIGLQLLFKIPLMIGVILTALDTLLFLVIQRYGIRKLEIIILLLLTIIASCFIVELFLSHPSAIGVLSGFIPSINNESLFVALAIIGATVMPHNFYLHSSVVQSRKFGRSSNQIRLACKYNLVDSAFALNMAFFVNMAILVVAAAVFHKQGYVVEELQDAHNLLEGLLNSKIAPIVFGLGLFCAGQSSTITGTMAGQIVMEGFIDFKLKPWIRRLITRSVAIIPAVIVIAIMGDEGTYKLLILSQVILSAQLPFAIVPLIRFTSDKVLMGEFVNNIWVNILSWLCALLIIALNLWLVGGYINDLFNDPSTIVYGALCIPVCLALIGLLLYITFRGLKLPCQRKYTLLERGSLNVDNATVQE